MRRAATLSDDGLLRWTLEREWGEGPTVCWIMLNPSSADAEVDDPTIRAIIKRSKGWDFGQLVVVNIYAIRASDPKVARRWAEREELPSEAVHNRSIVADMANAADKAVASWGAAPWATAWAYVVAAIIPELFCLGRTASGAPKHPLARGRHRIAPGQQLVPWRTRNDDGEAR